MTSQRRIYRPLGRRRGAVISALAFMLVMMVSYVALAAHQHADNWIIFAYDDRLDNTENLEHVDVTGNDNVYDGDIHSNGDVSVSGGGSALRLPVVIDSWACLSTSMSSRTPTMAVRPNRIRRLIAPRRRRMTTTRISPASRINTPPGDGQGRPATSALQVPEAIRSLPAT